MASEKITMFRTNADKTETIEQLPKTVSSQVYDSDNEQFLDETLQHVDGKFSELENKIEDILHQVRERLPNETNDNARIQELLNKRGRIYFKKDTYTISQTMRMYDGTFIECHPEAEFILAPLSRCWMFSSYKTLNQGSISWKGGIFNGNGNNQGPEVEPNHDVSRALGFFNFRSVEISNLVVKNIAGHGIAHWGNEYFHAHDIEFRQGLSSTHPNGGSRRDGITGSSKNIVFENIRGFTDDDFIAIIAGHDWEGSLNPISVDKVTIRNIKLERNDSDATFPCFRGFGVYCASGYEIKNMLVDNVEGAFNTEFMKIGSGRIGKMTIKNCNIQADQKTFSDSFGVLWVNKAYVDLITLDNITFTSLKTQQMRPFIRVDGSSVVQKVENKSIRLEYNVTETVSSEFVSLGHSSNIEEIINTDVECILATENQYKFLNRSTNTSEEIILLQAVGANGVINQAFHTDVSVGNRQFLSFRLGEGQANPGGTITINELKLLKDGVDTGLLNPSMLVTSSTVSATNNGNGTTTLQVTSNTHQYPNIRLNITLAEGEYTLLCNYAFISGNRQLGIDFRYENTRTFPSAKITGDFKKKNAVSGVYDLARTTATDPKYTVNSDDLTVDSIVLDTTKHNRYRQLDGKFVETNNNLLLTVTSIPITLLSSETFNLGAESKVQRMGNIVFGHIILYGKSQAGTYAANEHLVRASGTLGMTSTNKLEFSAVVFTGGSDGARYDDIFEMIFTGSSQIEIRALTPRSNVRWITLNFMFMV